MRRLIPLVLLVILAQRLVANPLALALPSPGDVIKLIDTLTKQDSSTNVNVKLGQTISQGKLLVARTRVDVAMERSSKNWRGRVLVTMKVPTEISYSIDLSEIRAEHIRLDPTKRKLVITMPKPRVEDVTPLLTSVTHDSAYKAGRFKIFDRTTSRDLQHSMLLHDYQARARKVGEENVPTIREQGRIALEQLLEKLLKGSVPNAGVSVE
jgi:hypothetical protein